jgi:hypothetical protein
MACLREYNFEILLKNTTLQECESYIKDHTEEAYLVPGGYKIKGVTLLGTTSTVGFSGNDIIFRHTKPCFGFFALRLKNEWDEIKRLRDQYIKDINVVRIK